MDKFVNSVIKHRRAIISVFVITAVVCIILQVFVKVNYNMVDYLPPNAQSTIALEIMDEEFTQAVPNARVMIRNVSIIEAVEYKQKLVAVDGVTEVLWLDDLIDIKQPLEMSDTDTVDEYYKNGNALFFITIAEGREEETCKAIQELIGDGNALAGEAADTAFVQQATGSEASNAMVILLPVIIAILVLSTTSWIEPLLFLATIGVSIMINMGTNIFFGEISFMTNSVSPILQLAVSLDYAIFLLHRFADNREKYGDLDEAMGHAIKTSLPTVAASALTTIFGFMALSFMNFQIGADLGINLVKGIAFSFISVIVFLPALTLCIYKFIDKTQHRNLMPGFKNVNRVLSKLAIPAVVLVALILVPSYLGQTNNTFAYSNNDLNIEGGQDSVAIEEEFGQSTIMVLLVPRGDVAREQGLTRELEQLEHVTSVMSYTNTVASSIPPEYLDEDITSQFYSENYARIIVYTDTPTEGDVAFQTVENIQNLAASYYGDTVYSLGQSANLYDIKNLVKEDNRRVNLIAIIAISCVLLITFKSAILPLILLITIETGIWFNLSLPYFSGTSINFIGYLVLNTVQLGATIDYAILLTDHYRQNRRILSKREAISRSLGETFKSILISASILTTAGFTISATSSNPAISDLGLLLGRGALCSFVMVTCFLPAMLTIFDKVIGATTYKSGFSKRK